MGKGLDRSIASCVRSVETQAQQQGTAAKEHNSNRRANSSRANGPSHRGAPFSRARRRVRWCSRPKRGLPEPMTPHPTNRLCACTGALRSHRPRLLAHAWPCVVGGRAASSVCASSAHHVQKLGCACCWKRAPTSRFGQRTCIVSIACGCPPFPPHPFQSVGRACARAAARRIVRIDLLGAAAASDGIENRTVHSQALLRSALVCALLGGRDFFFRPSLGVDSGAATSLGLYRSGAAGTC